MINAKKFRSCFIVDVSIEHDKVILTDSSRIRYIVNIANAELKSDFTIWFNTIFQKGIAQTLTIFAYEEKEISECDIELHIIKFLNLNK